MSSQQSGQNINAGLHIAVLGAGKMGGILLQAFLRSGLFTAEQIAATVAHDLRAEALTGQFGLAVTTDNLRAVEGADIVLLEVKPTQVVPLVREVAPSLKQGVLLLSIAASVKTTAIEESAEGLTPVIRAMPNTPAMLGAGITAFWGGRFVGGGTA